MNTSEFYERQRHTPTAPPRAAHPDGPAEARELAAFGDPSVRRAVATQAALNAALGRATHWVRPTELTDIGMRTVGRVIDRGFWVQERAIRAAVRGVRAAAERVAPPRVPPTTAHERDGMAL